MVQDVAPLMHKKQQRALEKCVAAIISCQSIQPSQVSRSHAAMNANHCQELQKAVRTVDHERGLFTKELWIAWFKYNIQHLHEIPVSIDWTEFHADGHSCFAVCLMFANKVSVPVFVQTVDSIRFGVHTTRASRKSRLSSP